MRRGARDGEVQRRAEEAARYHEQLVAIRGKAEQEAERRAEVEQQIITRIEALREAEARQIKQIENAQIEAARRASEEEQRLLNLEAIRGETEELARQRT